MLCKDNRRFNNFLRDQRKRLLFIAGRKVLGGFTDSAIRVAPQVGMIMIRRDEPGEQRQKRNDEYYEAPSYSCCAVPFIGKWLKYDFLLHCITFSLQRDNQLWNEPTEYLASSMPFRKYAKSGLIAFWNGSNS